MEWPRNGELGGAIQLFLAANASRVRPATLRQYQSICSLFERHQGTWRPVSSIQIGDLIVFLDHCRQVRGNGPSALRSKVKLLQAFFDWLQTTGEIAVSPARGLPLPRRALPRVEPLPVESVQRLLRELEEEARARPRDWLPTRDLVLVMLLYGLGLRLGELRKLRWRDLQYSKGAGYHFVIREEASKGGYSGGVAPLPEELLYWLRRWAVLRETFLPPQVNPHVLISDPAKSSGAGLGSPISESAVQRRLEILAARHGLAESDLGSVHPHRFRHTFAVQHLMDDNDLKTVSLLLRHRNPQTTLTTYSTFTDAQFAVKARRHNPLRGVFNSQTFPSE